MKKAKAIIFLLLALFFVSKNLACYAADPSVSVCYALDLEEKETAEKGEKDPLSGKEKSEDWMISQSGPCVQNATSTLSFRYYQESSFLSPYSEISPRPPESDLLS